MLVLFFSAATISTASARVCFLPDSTDCGEGDVVGSGNVDVPCQYSGCPAHNEAYQECYTERIYNNGGVNVECKQVKCKLSKSDCEKQEANPNSSQCCNFDSASGCYYMGSCKLCNRDVYDSEKNLGEGYNCYPCKDKNGTFYNCTAIEKECKDINPNYTSSCSDSQIAEEVEGIKDSKGNQCYTCKDKPLEIVKPVITITYKETYNSLTPSTGADSEEYYYKTLKFTATSSDNISRTILMKTYPAKTCSKPQYTTGSPVTINEGTETIIGSRCGTQSRELLVSSVAALDTFINGTKVYSFEPYYSSHLVFDGLDGKTVETNDYTVKFVKEGKCLYEYTQATTNNTCGYSGNLDENNRCKRNSCCWLNLSRVNSIVIQSGQNNAMPIYNKISNTSASCVDDKGVTRYQTICQGTKKSSCNTSAGYVFTRKCVSDSYNNGFEVKGNEWGTCSCDTEKGAYDTIEECRSGTNSGCKISEGCYKTCESLGYYSTETACLNSGTVNPGGSSYGSITLQGSCSQTEDCYKFNVNGFYIRNNTKSTVSCHDAQYSNSTTASISVYLLLQSSGKYATDINGKEVSDITPPGSQYPANQEYYICGDVSNNNIPAHVRFTLDGQEFAGPNTNLNDSMYYSDGRGICKKISFENGSVHTVWWFIETRNMSDGKSYTCKLQ